MEHVKIAVLMTTFAIVILDSKEKTVMMVNLFEISCLLAYDGSVNTKQVKIWARSYSVGHAEIVRNVPGVHAQQKYYVRA